MNLRQKAKHYKQLYERLGNLKISPVTIHHEPLHQYRTVKSMHFPKECDPDFIPHKMATVLADSLVKFIGENMSLEQVSGPIKFDDMQTYKAEFNFWYGDKT